MTHARALRRVAPALGLLATSAAAGLAVLTAQRCGHPVDARPQWRASGP